MVVSKGVICAGFQKFFLTIVLDTVIGKGHGGVAVE